MLSEVIAYCDQNHNLNLPREGQEWKTRLWLAMIRDEVITPLAYDSFISPVSGRLRERARVLSSGAGPPFNGKFPFSWTIKDLVDGLLRQVEGECFCNKDFGLRNFRVFFCTVTAVEPLLRGPPLSGHTLLSGQISKSQKYLLHSNKETTSIKRPSLLSGRGHLRAVPNSVFLFIITSFKLSFSFFHDTNSRSCFEF